MVMLNRDNLLLINYNLLLASGACSVSHRDTKAQRFINKEIANGSEHDFENFVTLKEIETKLIKFRSLPRTRKK